MKEQAIQKINKVGKISRIIAIVCKVIMSIALVISLVSAIGCFLAPEDAMKVAVSTKMRTITDYEAMGMQISEEAMESMLDISDEPGQMTRVEMKQNLFVNGSFRFQSRNQEFIPVGASFEGSILTMEMMTDEVTVDLRDVAGMMMVSVIATTVTLVTLCFIESLCKAFRDCTSPFEENVIKKMQNLAISLIPWTVVTSITESVLQSFLSGGMQLNITVDMGVVLVVLVVIVLVYIFKYGAVLQQESDETL